MRDNKMKEFYALANKVLRIKRSHPVVTKVHRETEDGGDTEIIDDKTQVDRAIGHYFADIYKRPDHKKLHPSDIDFRVDESMSEEWDNADRIPLFSTEEVDNAANQSNFNKGLGPDCFDGNLLKKD